MTQEIIEKVEIKERKHFSPEAFLVKTIKFFDVFNTGNVSYGDFQKGLEKVGLIYSDAVIKYFNNFFRKSFLSANILTLKTKDPLIMWLSQEKFIIQPQR